MKLFTQIAHSETHEGDTLSSCCILTLLGGMLAAMLTGGAVLGCALGAGIGLVAGLLFCSDASDESSTR